MKSSLNRINHPKRALIVFFVSIFIAFLGSCSKTSSSSTPPRGDTGGSINKPEDPNVEPIKLPPKEFTPSLDFDTRIVGETLNCLGKTTGDDGVSISYKYNWYISLDPNASYNELPAEISSSLVIKQTMAHHWVKCQMTALDSSGLEVKSLLSRFSAIVNSAPSEFKPTASSYTVFLGEDILCSGLTSDIDGDELTYEFTWKKSFSKLSGFETIEGANLNSYSAAKEDIKKYLRCEVAAKDRLGRITSAQSDNIEVKNQLPSNFYSAVYRSDDLDAGIALNTKVGDSLKCLGHTNDLDGDTLNYSFKWVYSDALDGLNIKDIPGAVRSELIVPESLAHKFIRCDITATDIHGDSSRSISSLMPVLNLAPLPFYSKINVPSAIVSDDIECIANAKDRDGDVLAYTFKWFSKSSIDGPQTLLPEEVYQILHVQPSQSRRYISCQASASDGWGVTTDSSISSSIYIKNSAPRNFIASSFKEHSVLFETIECGGVTSDIDEDSLNYEFKWFTSNSVNGPWNQRQGATSSSLFLNISLSHKVIVCEKTAKDDYGGQVVSSRSAWSYVDNTSPEPFITTLSIDKVRVGDKVQCQGDTTDIENDTLSYTYQWSYSDDSTNFYIVPLIMNEGAQARELEITRSLSHRFLRCAISAKDGHGGITVAKVSRQATVLNTAPENFVASIPSTLVQTNQTINCKGATTDNDNDNITYKYKWMISDAEFSGWTDLANQTERNLLVAPNFSRKYIKCEISASDFPFNGLTVSQVSSPIYVSNTNPEPFTAVVDKRSVLVGEMATCSGSTRDNDADTLTYSYQWLFSKAADGVFSIIASEPNSIIAITSELSHGFLVCRMLADDGFSGQTKSSLSEIVEIKNTSPKIFSAIPSLAAVQVSGVVLCNGSTSDVDLDTVEYAYEWWVYESESDLFGKKRNSANEMRIVVNAFYAHKYLRCRITATDKNNGSFTTDLSPIVKVENTDPFAFSAMTDKASAIVNEDIQCLSSVADFDDIDGDVPYITSYQWYYRNASNGVTQIPNETAKTYKTSSSLAHRNISCEIIINDGFGGRTISGRSTDVVIINSNPNAFSAIIDKPSAKIGEVLTCSGGPIDNDADALTYTYQWRYARTLGGPYFDLADSTAASLTVPTLLAVAHGYLQCEMTAKDSFGGITIAQNLPSAAVDNTSPVLTAVSDKTVEENALLTFSVSATDIDFDTVSYSCLSCPTGASLSEDTGVFTYSPGYGVATTNDPITSFTIKVLAFDAFGGSQQSSFTISVRNKDRPPSIVITCAASRDETSAVIFSYVASDPDPEDLPVVTISGSISQEGPEPTVSHNLALKRFEIVGSYSHVPHSGSKSGNVWYRNWTPTLTVSSGSGLTASASCTTAVQDVDRAPSLSITNCPTQYENNTQSINYTSSDPDGDALSFTNTGGQLTLVDIGNSTFYRAGSYDNIPHNGSYYWEGSTAIYYRDSTESWKVTANGLTATSSCSLRILDVDRPPTWDGNVRVDDYGEITRYTNDFIGNPYGVSDADGDEISYSRITNATKDCSWDKTVYYPDTDHRYRVDSSLNISWNATANGKTISATSNRKNAACYYSIYQKTGSHYSYGTIGSAYDNGDQCDGSCHDACITANFWDDASFSSTASYNGSTYQPGCVIGQKCKWRYLSDRGLYYSFRPSYCSGGPYSIVDDYSYVSQW